MSEIDTGGPAFPHSSEDPDGQIRTHWFGMTLRDYFAAKAMQAVIGNSVVQKAVANEEVEPYDLCLSFYEWADFMLQARKLK